MPERKRTTVPERLDHEVQYRTIHGYRRAFVRVGQGPAVLLIHGIGDCSDTWRAVLPALAGDHTVIAPDLLGHGRSDKPRADYSVAAYANAMRDLLTVLGVERATIVGHSLGGGVAMQFAYQYPERCERLVLVSTGGVSHEVHPMLRLASAPPAGVVLPLLPLPPMRFLVAVGLRLLQRLNTDLGRDTDQMLGMFDALPDATARRAFLRTVRAVVDWRGQAITMLDRSYLAHDIPTLLVWGAHDAVLPLSHAHVAHQALPASRLEVFEEAGHFPHHADAARFASVLREFLATTEPAPFDPAEWRARLQSGRPPQRLPGARDLATGVVGPSFPATSP